MRKTDQRNKIEADGAVKPGKIAFPNDLIEIAIAEWKGEVGT
jgi:hypothetical protein